MFIVDQLLSVPERDHRVVFTFCSSSIIISSMIPQLHVLFRHHPTTSLVCFSLTKAGQASFKTKARNLFERRWAKETFSDGVGCAVFHTSTAVKNGSEEEQCLLFVIEHPKVLHLCSRTRMHFLHANATNRVPPFFEHHDWQGVVLHTISEGMWYKFVGLAIRNKHRKCEISCRMAS